MSIPALEHSCGSWICHNKTGQTVETFDRATAEFLDRIGWTVKTALQHLVDLNTTTRNGAER